MQNYAKVRNGWCWVIVSLKTPALHISIQDNGQGIAPEVLPHVFEPFFSTQAPKNGMGLGLYIVHSIMQEHAGCIAISSQPKQGTTVSLQFPLSGETPWATRYWLLMMNRLL